MMYDSISAIAPPRMGSKQEDAIILSVSNIPSEAKAAGIFELPPETRINVDAIPIIGEKGRICFTTVGKYLPKLNPHKTGRRTRVTTEFSTDIPSTIITHRRRR